jgi:nicotinamide mononucleotide adenylyltransferase
MLTTHVTDIDHEINHVLGGIKSADGETKRPARIMLLAGADLIATMSTPGVWAEKDLDHIFSDFGTVVVERSGIDMEEALSRLKRWEDNIIVVPQLIANDVSSTKIRLLLKRDMSVKWMIPHSVDKYIKENGLYTDEADQKEKQRQEAGTS